MSRTESASQILASPTSLGIAGRDWPPMDAPAALRARGRLEAETAVSAGDDDLLPAEVDAVE